MPKSCYLRNLFTNDVIGYVKTVSVWAENDSHVNLKLVLSDAHGGVSPPHISVPPTTGTPYSFTLTHSAESDDETITVTLTSEDGATTYDTDRAEYVDVRTTPDVNPNPPPSTSPPPPPPPPPQDHERGLPAQVYRGTYTPTGANAVLVEVLSRRRGDKHFRTVLLKQATLTVQRYKDELLNVWEVGFPRIVTVDRLVVLRVHLTDWRGEVIRSATRVLSE